MNIYNINKNGNLEVENDVIRYRVPLIEFPTEDIDQIEKDMKKKATTLNHSPYHLTPFRVASINSFINYYYDVKNLKSFMYIRQLPFKDKLKYYASLIAIAQNEQVNVIWDKHNFVVDDFEETIKAIIYETDYIKLHEKTDALEGIRELILISLTTLDSIVGKPRRTNFIDQDEDIIKFSETIYLQIDSLDDLDHFIQTKLIEYEYGQSSYTDEEPSTDETPKKNKQSFIQKIVPNMNKKQSKKPKGYKPPSSKKSSKMNGKQLLMYGGIGVLLVLGIILNMLPSSSEQADGQANDPVTEVNSSNYENEQDESDSNESLEEVSNTEHDDQLLKAYRYTLADNHEEALQILEGVGYKNLPEQDKMIMVSIYQEQNMYEKAIQLNSSIARSIVNDLIAEGNTDKIMDIQESLDNNNPYIDFEVAYLENEYEKVLNLKDDLELNGRKEKQITEAYLNLDQIAKAEQFAQNIGNPDLLQMVESYK